MPIRRTFTDIKVDGKSRLTNATPITEFGATSIAGSFLDIIASESDKIYSDIEYLHRALDPTRNYGVELDNLGYLLGISRTNSYAAVDDSTTNFNFYIDKRTNMTAAQLINNLYPGQNPMRQKLASAGYIDNANNPTKIIIPAGTQITNTNKSITYTTLNVTEISNSSPYGFAGVAANNPGTFSNVQSNTLVQHNLTQEFLLRDIGKFILCTNNFPIQTGADGMTDSEYRYKITTAPQSRNTNELTIRQTILNIPGIRNVYFQRGKYGYGTYGVILEGTSPLVSDGLVQIVQQRIDNLDGNDAAFVYAPKYRGVEMSFELFIDIGSDSDRVREDVRNLIIDYINNVPIGGTIIWNEVVALIINTPGVLDFVTDYFKLGEYNAYEKLNKKQVVLRTINQRSYDDEKFYCDRGLIKLCTRQQG